MTEVIVGTVNVVAGLFGNDSAAAVLEEELRREGCGNFMVVVRRELAALAVRLLMVGGDGVVVEGIDADILRALTALITALYACL